MLIRPWLLVLAPLLAGCAGGPGALGITGPGGAGPTSFGAVTLPSTLSSDNALVLPPGTPVDQGAKFAPSVVPTYGADGRYYGQ